MTAGRRVGVLAAAVLPVCGCSSAASRDALSVQPVPQQVTVTEHTIGAFGVALTDSTGRALYMFPPDARQQVTCTGPCAGTWPPMTIATGATPKAGPGVSQKLLGTLPDPNTGARVTTYNGFPLYRYAGDTTPGTANGQALFLDGGPWYLLNPAGTPLTAGPAGAP